MMNINPFFPRKGQTKTLAVTTTTARVQVLDNASSTSTYNVRIYNAGTVAAFINWGDGTVTAATTDMPIAPGATEVLSLQGSNIAAITASGTATLYITEGSGI